MAAPRLERESPPELDEHLMYEILNRVDGITLAAAATLSPEFCSVVRGEALWENLCNSRWPSTKDCRAMSFVKSAGGFRKLFSQCYPLIHIRNYPTFETLNPTSNNASLEWLKEEEDKEHEDDHDKLGDVDDESSAIRADDLVSLVDVIFNNRKVFSKVICRSTENSCTLFSDHPFRISLLNFSDDNGDKEDSEPVEQMPITHEGEMRIGGKSWKEFLGSVRLSWILVNQKTQKMVNLASWRPVGGERKRPYNIDSDYIIRFRTILPRVPSVGHRQQLLDMVVHCNIAMKCKLVTTVGGGGRVAHLKLAELSLQLEDMAGHCLDTPKHGLCILAGALSCTARSSDGGAVLSSYHQLTRAQQRREEELMGSLGEKSLVDYLSMAFMAAFSYLYSLFF